MFKFPIAISLSPNTQGDDVLITLKTIFTPWRWKKGKMVSRVEKWFTDQYHSQQAVSFSSGRAAFYAILQAFGIGKGDEVIIQGFTCVAVPDPVIWAGAKPVYVDIDESLNLEVGLIEKSITKKTKAIVVQHTFGIPAQIDMIQKIAQKHHLVLVEDCSHALGACYQGKKVGTYGDAAFFSFGRDKVISSVFGGMAIINSKFPPAIAFGKSRWRAGKIQSFGSAQDKSAKLREYQSRLAYPGYFWIFQQLLHPLAFSIILPLYNYYLGKLILIFLQKLKLLSLPVYPIEKSGGREDILLTRYPNALANLIVPQLNKLEAYNSHRQEIAERYFAAFKDQTEIQLPRKEKGAIYLRFNILSSEAEKIWRRAKSKGILLGNWYKNVIDPQGVNLEKISFYPQKLTNAREMAKLSVNLPTYPRLKMIEVDEIIKVVLDK